MFPYLFFFYDSTSVADCSTAATISIPQRCLTQLLTKSSGTPISQIGQWLPEDGKRRNPSPLG